MRSVPGETASPGSFLPGSTKSNYVGRRACASCHAAEDSAWRGSDHDRAMDFAADSTVLGRFDGSTLRHHGMASRFFRKDGAYQVRTEGPDGNPAEYRVDYVFGVRPLQQYLTYLPDGRLQALPIAWDTEKKRWFHLQKERRMPGDWLHWTRDGQNWNGMCADCHSTGLKRGYHAASGTFATTWKEVDVSCEACHGPGSRHADSRGRHPMTIPLSGGGPRTLKAPADPETRRAAALEVDACARCHARRMPLEADYASAKDFLDGFAPELLREGVYHADGQILDEDYEYGSFLQSRMHAAGVRCSDCHEPHSLKTRAVGNALCTRCHEPSRFDVRAHHGHAAGSLGSRCVDCHMPAKTYMEVDPRRDHSLRIPRPDLTVRFGTPNACTGCHKDRSAAWAAGRIVARHGPIRKPHFSDLLAQGRSGRPGADSALARLAGDTSFPPIARASALSHLAPYMHALASAALARGVSDRDPLVRREAALGLESADPVLRLSLLPHLLTDSLRVVRVAAAQALVTAATGLPASHRAAYAQALKEYRASLDANLFFPGGRFNLARHHELAGRNDSAVLEYGKALELDDRLVQARINLASLLDHLGRSTEAEAHLRQALRLNPEYVETPYLLGLQLAGQGRTDSAARYIGLAAKRMPDNPRVRYNLGLLLHRLGRMAEAEAALLEAGRLAPGDAEMVNALRWIRKERQSSRAPTRVP